jgi:hypothetical protein
MSLPQQIIVGLSFDKSNELWKAIHIMLDASIEAETVNALSKENKGEDRAWHCGRADALNAFKDILINTRNDILRDQGRPSEDHNPSENGM